ncbi:hypothetical protein AKO1_001213 [Acrasis kona]|uniref:Uncharacterized protein n=1 Tax=Acrasis kona TaxID=1008807 RepID=A0AAW2ZAJ0_9EUKA
MAKAAGWDHTKYKIVGGQPVIDSWEPTVIINPSKAVNMLGWNPKRQGFLEEIQVYYQSYLSSKQ